MGKRNLAEAYLLNSMAVLKPGHSSTENSFAVAIDLTPSRLPSFSGAPTSPIYLFGILFPLYFFEFFLLRADLAVGFILLRATDVGQVAGHIRENVVGLPILLNPGYLMGGRLLASVLAAVFGTLTLKPAATSEFSLLRVLAQPTARTSNAIVGRILNGVRIRFMVFCVLVLIFLEFGSSLPRSSTCTVGKMKGAITIL